MEIIAYLYILIPTNTHSERLLILIWKYDFISNMGSRSKRLVGVEDIIQLFRAQPTSE